MPHSLIKNRTEMSLSNQHLMRSLVLSELRERRDLGVICEREGVSPWSEACKKDQIIMISFERKE